MLNEELYERLGHALGQCRVDMEVEDVLLELAEAMADTGITGREISVREQVGRAEIAAYGTCEESGDEDEPEVFVRMLTVNGKEFEIEDYLL